MKRNKTYIFVVAVVFLPLNSWKFGPEFPADQNFEDFETIGWSGVVHRDARKLRDGPWTEQFFSEQLLVDRSRKLKKKPR